MDCAGLYISRVRRTLKRLANTVVENNSESRHRRGSLGGVSAIGRRVGASGRRHERGLGASWGVMHVSSRGFRISLELLEALYRFFCRLEVYWSSLEAS